MKFLEKQLDKHRKLFEPGGKLHLFHPIFELQDTFLFTPKDTTAGRTHIRDTIDMKRSMITVLIALIPCILFAIFNAGRQYNVVSGLDATTLQHWLQGLKIVMPIILVSYLVGGLWEVLFAIVRKHEVNEGFLITGMLFPLTLPPTIPLWQVAVGISFGVVIGKEIFGGTGFNVLNPALTARAYLFFAHAQQMSGEVWTKLAPGAPAPDTWTAATPLSVAAEAGLRHVPVVDGLREAGYTWSSMFNGLEGGSLGETSAIPILLGAVLLLLTGVGSWRIMLACVLGLFLGTSALNLLPDQIGGHTITTFTELPFHYHLVMGGFLFGAVFMATDPVSAAATNRGKWIYGLLIGVVTALVRVTNPGFPEGTMLAILFMNVMAPLIDHFVVQAQIKKRTAYLRKFSYAKG